MNTFTDEQGRGDDTGPFLLANVMADALVTFGWDQLPQVHEGTPTSCHDCGRAAIRYLTVQHTWVLLEPGETACRPVPPGEHWHVTGNGIAVRLLGPAPTPTGACRTPPHHRLPGSAPLIVSGDGPCVGRARRNVSAQTPAN